MATPLEGADPARPEWVSPLMWEHGEVSAKCEACGETLHQTGNHFTIIDHEMPVGVGFLACTGFKNQDRVLAVSRRDDHTAFGVPGGKVDVEDGALTPEDFGRTLRHAAQREVWEECGISLDPDLFEFVHQGVCPGGEQAYWQVTLRHPNFDWVAVTQEGEGVVTWVTWKTLEEGPFGVYNRKLRVHMRAMDGDLFDLVSEHEHLEAQMYAGLGLDREG
jgi:8-oxo-dGTP pyrophosphatase MutT (NUDIX family)